MMIQYEKKIVPYIDGSLSKEDLAEFEAFVRTHPDFESKIQDKRDEMTTLKNMIPDVYLSKESQESLASEMRSSIFNLLKEEPKSVTDLLRLKWEEWTSR